MAKRKPSGDLQIGENISRLMEAHPHIKTQTALAAETGIAQATIGRALRGESMLSAEYVQRIARALGASLDEVYGVVPAVGASSRADRPIKTWEHPEELPAGEFALVRRLDVKLSAGNGHEDIDVTISEDLLPQAFRADWIRKMGLKPNRLASVTADGDSMEPSIHDGDALVINLDETAVIDGKVYWIWYDGGARVKRLYRLPGGGLRIKSDNAAYSPIDLTSDQAQHVRVIGRVRHKAGEGGL